MVDLLFMVAAAAAAAAVRVVDDDLAVMGAEMVDLLASGSFAFLAAASSNTPIFDFIERRRKIRSRARFGYFTDAALSFSRAAMSSYNPIFDLVFDDDSSIVVVLEAA